MRLLKALSLFAALALLGGAVLDAQTGLIRQTLGAAPDGGKPVLGGDYMNATKAGPLARPRPSPPEQKANQAMQANQAEAPASKDAGK